MKKYVFALLMTIAISAIAINKSTVRHSIPNPYSAAIPMKTINLPGGHIAHVALRPDQATVYDSIHNHSNSYIVISKRDLRLYIYEHRDNNETLIAHYPVCLGFAKGNKHIPGDMKTPESTPNAPFTISEIKDASQWYHDFGDGRGSIKAYGNWFIRLDTGHKGIGIHGSTNNEQTIPGRASEGCIRLRDADIISLKENYAFCGMKVTILPD